MKNEKVGIITFHNPLNFGSSLQAYAMEQVLEKNGYRPRIIDFFLESDMKHYKLFRTHMYRKQPKSFIRDLLFLPIYIRRKRHYAAFAQKYLNIAQPRYYATKCDLTPLNNEYDAFICGSDQIWNLNCTERFVAPYFLDFVADNKTKIAYAPSMPSPVDEKYYPQLRKSIERLDYVSVREAQTVDYLRDTVGVNKDITHVVDPTLLLDAQDYVSRFALGTPQQKHIFVYNLGDIDHTLVQKALETAKKTGLPIKYVYPRTIFAMRSEQLCIDMGPEEFLQAVNDAAYVITNSFHASVFAIHFHKPLCVFSRPGSTSRMTNLLTQLGLEDSLYTPENDRWMTTAATDETDDKRRALAAKSLAFLLGALKNE